MACFAQQRGTAGPVGRTRQMGQQYLSFAMTMSINSQKNHSAKVSIFLDIILLMFFLIWVELQGAYDRLKCISDLSN